MYIFDFPGGSDGKASAYNAYNAGGMGLIPGSGRSPGEGNGNPLQYSCLENTMLSDFTFTIHTYIYIYIYVQYTYVIFLFFFLGTKIFH